MTDALRKPQQIVQGHKDAMHILLIPSHYPDADRPVRGIFFQEQALALRKRGHKVGVLVPPTGLEFVRYIRRTKRLAFVSVDRETADIMVYRMYLGWFLRRFPALHARAVAMAGRITFAKYCREQGSPDIIHAHDAIYGGYLAVGIKQSLDIPTILTEHSTAHLSGKIHPRQKPIVGDVLSNIDSLLVVGTNLAGAIRPYVPAKHIEPIGNMVDTEFFVPDSGKLTSDRFILSTIGGLIVRKGFELLLTAFGTAFHGQEVRLRIVGAGPERERLENLVKRLDLQEQVTFLGELSREDVRDVIQESHVLVSASNFETFGISLIEALACGKPVIATRSGGPEDFVNERNGLLVDAGDVQALAEAMQRLVANYEQYDPEQIRAECVARFSRQAIVNRLESIYAAALRVGGE